MISSTLAMLAQVALPAPARAQDSTARPVVPVLAFPEPGLDDSAAYQGYQTRLFRDAASNTVQLYLDERQGRVVHVLADAENASVGFTARGRGGRPAALRWDGPGAAVARVGRLRTLEHRLVAPAPMVHLGQFLLGSMRVERDFQYERSRGRARMPLAGPAFAQPELERMLAAMARLAPPERTRHLALLGARNMGEVRARLRPTVTTRQDAAGWTARIVQPSVDGRDTMAVEVRTDARRVVASGRGDSLTLRARTGPTVAFTVRVSTTGAPLTAMTRDEIFTPAFLRFLTAARADSAAPRGRLMERQARGVELLASREKLMAGLPTYATYFGRDLMVSALMMRDVWRPEVLEAVVGSVLRNLSPDGEVSHEEALGGQAVRESAAEYATLVDAHVRATARGSRITADSLLDRARLVLRDARRTRQNYHMVDDEFQLPVLAARWLGDPGVSADRKRAFLLDSSDGGGTRLDRLLRELAVVARWSAAYVARPDVQNLVAFARRDSTHWASASWRDSGAGYANGRFAMDVNAIWVPHALEATGRIIDALGALGLPADSLGRRLPAPAGGTSSPGTAMSSDDVLARYVRDRAALQRAVEVWRGAERHFLVRLTPTAVRTQVRARLAAMPAAERTRWTPALDAAGAAGDSLTFLAVALDSAGRPLGVANTDPATALFLGPLGPEPRRAAADSAVLRDVRLFTRPYPVGLLVDGVGPVVANDAYAAPAVWREFARDPYHGPKVVWGREVNLFLLGAADRLAESSAAGQDLDTARTAYVRELRAAIDRVRTASDAAGFKSELWSYELRDGRVVPVRYGSGNDVQLWTTTDLAVQFALARAGR